MTRTALIALAYIDYEIDADAKRNDDGSIKGASASLNGMTWMTDDLEGAETLREQLKGLLGEPSWETMMPTLTHEAMRKLLWPGSVSLDNT